MNFLTYIQSLLPVVGKGRVLTQFRAQLLDLDEIAIPAYDGGLSVFSGDYRFKSQAMRNVETQFTLLRTGARNANFVQHTYAALTNFKTVLPGLISEVEKLKGTDIARDAVDLRMATAMQLAEYGDFMVNYALRLLQWAYATEAQSGTSSASATPIPRAEMKWITDNLVVFVRVVSLFQMPAKEMLSKLDTVPRVETANQDIAEIQSVAGKRTDPINLGFLPPAYSPALRLGKAWAEWSVERHNQRKEIKRALELRLLDMRLAQEGNPDANLGGQIEYAESRINKLGYKIAQTEELARG